MPKWAALVLAGACFGATSAVAHADDVVRSDLEHEFVVAINELRAGHGLPALQVHSELVDKTRSWSATMAAAGRIWHSDLANGVTAPWAALGENVGMGGSVSTLHDAFVASPHHYENLVAPDFEYIGVGVVVADDGTVFVTEEFMTLQHSLKADPVAPDPLPAPTPPSDGAPSGGAPAIAPIAAATDKTSPQPPADPQPSRDRGEPSGPPDARAEMILDVASPAEHTDRGESAAPPADASAPMTALATAATLMILTMAGVSVGVAKLTATQGRPVSTLGPGPTSREPAPPR